MYIKQFNSKEDGYNMTDNCINYHSFKLNKNSIEKFIKTRTKKVISINRFTGEFIKEFNSITEAAKEYGLSTTNISGVCKQRNGVRFLKDMVFVYSKDYNTNKDYKVLVKGPQGIKRSNEYIRKRQLQGCTGKTLYKYDLNNNLICTYPSRAEAERQEGFKKEFLRKNLNKNINNFIYTHTIKDIV